MGNHQIGLIQGLMDFPWFGPERYRSLKNQANHNAYFPKININF